MKRSKPILKDFKNVRKQELTFSNFRAEKQSFDKLSRNLLSIPADFSCRFATSGVYSIETFLTAKPKCCSIDFSQFTSEHKSFHDGVNTLFQHSFFDDNWTFENFLSQSETVQSQKHKRVSEIVEQLRQSKALFRKNSSLKLLIEIKNLVQELHSLITLHYKEYRRIVRHNKKNNYRNFVRDIRGILRGIIKPLMKLFSDFSGCEEDVITVNTYSVSLFFTNRIKNHDKQKVNSRCFRSIYQ